MKPNLYRLEITLHEATFFASHELDAYYFTEPLIGNYAMAYALGLVKSPYDRYHAGYGEDLPVLNERGIYVTPAWPESELRYRVERFNCQSESFFSAMTNNALVEIAGRQFLRKKGNFWADGKTGKKIARATNRPQTGILKLLCPLNRFVCHVISKEKLFMPQYVRLGKFMSKAKIFFGKTELQDKKKGRAEYKLINPLDLDPECRILFGDTINIHPTPLLRKAEIEGEWWTDTKGEPVIPAGLEFRGI